MRKYVMQLLPIIINFVFSGIWFVEDIFGGWFGGGTVAFAQFIVNIAVTPIYIIKINHKLIGKNFKTDIFILFKSYVITKLALLIGLINSCIFASMDIVGWMIFRTEWVLSSVILITCWLIVKALSQKK